MSADRPLAITGLGVLSALGDGVDANHAAILAGKVPFRPLGELFGETSRHAHRAGGWIENRKLLLDRKWAPATMAALHVARQAIAAAGWSAEECRDAALVVGTSRGNAANWLEPWPKRRPFKLMAASNSIHSEPATAISIEFGITGPNHVLASGCSAGLDAAGIAMMLVRSGAAQRALAVAVDLPLVETLLDHYVASNMLSRAMTLNPYDAHTSGFIPAEGAAAMAIEDRSGNHRKLLHYACNSDAADPVGIPKDGGRTPELIEAAKRRTEKPCAICTHATGTAVQAAADPTVLRRSFGDDIPSVHLLKPFVGHAIGASGLMETVILCRFLEDGLLPPNVADLTEPKGIHLPSAPLKATGPVYKLSHGMGGHNALLVIS